MTINSPTSSICRHVINLKKGSTYGKQQCWSSDHSFQEPTRDGGLDNAYGAQVLSSQAIVYTLCYRSVTSSL